MKYLLELILVTFSELPREIIVTVDERNSFQRGDGARLGGTQLQRRGVDGRRRRRRQRHDDDDDDDGEHDESQKKIKEISTSGDDAVGS